jgi:hypothetical protein
MNVNGKANGTGLVDKEDEEWGQGYGVASRSPPCSVLFEYFLPSALSSTNLEVLFVHFK